MVQGASAARAGGLGAALRSGARQTRIGRTGADSPLSGFCHPSLGNGLTGYVDFSLTDSLDAEFVLQQAFGTIDNRYVATIGLRHTFIPEWKWFSPTAGIGTGYQYIDDKVPPKPIETHNQMAYVSLGVRGFITRRFMWRADWRKYDVFTHQNQNEEPEEWKFGLAVFF